MIVETAHIQMLSKLKLALNCLYYRADQNGTALMHIISINCSLTPIPNQIIPKLFAEEPAPCPSWRLHKNKTVHQLKNIGLQNVGSHFFGFDLQISIWHPINFFQKKRQNIVYMQKCYSFSIAKGARHCP